MTKTLDLAGLGIGPFNLSIAALLQEAPELKTAFFDQKPRFSWHPGMMLPGVRLQTSYLKDLVTGVAPWSPYSFLNYLVQHGRFYPFMNTGMASVSRAEFADYMGWVASRLDNLYFNRAVERVQFDGDHFQIRFAGEAEPVTARNLCLGTGKTPHIPEACQAAAGDHCFHNMELALRQPDVSGQRVTVVGGGQSGAEVVLSLLQGDWGRPRAITWFSRRSNFEPLDETPFTNEYFTPQYVDTFHGLPEDRRLTLVAQQKLASDGISPVTLEALHQRLYEHHVADGGSPAVSLQPDRTVESMSADRPFRLETVNGLDGTRESSEADRVILCTGFESRLPAYLDDDLRQRLDTDSDGQLRLGPDFEARWDGPIDRRIYAVNAGRHSHGIAEPQMSLMCWRSARIINHLSDQVLFPVTASVNMVDWTAVQRESDRPTETHQTDSHQAARHESEMGATSNTI
ncbi:lysine/ornithine N-monooxygenase [Tamilnaduibacter salinus]|uniref:Lysine/ornithine N-monooxygenase n=1 Tax=Tamilnaduibacter salinus TaxID=1484056 RepID=A0A2U1CW79_9GAMM|nr:SidA/IucD/PvdA family monooxygenase [Tamilnaduibacter salinus]PVY75996.1 lysine/ornithine N-monooxygenase [Tamilnaduibacter salinus]